MAPLYHEKKKKQPENGFWHRSGRKYIFLRNERSNVENHAPSVDEPVKRPCRIRRTGRGQDGSIARKNRQNEAVIALERLLSVAEYRGDRRGVENDRKVVRNNVADRAVRASFDGAATDAVPERDFVPFQERAFFGDAFRRFLSEHGGDDAPEAVLRVPVKEHLFPRFHRGKAAEDQNMRIRPVKRRDGMDDFRSLHKRIITHEFKKTNQ